MKAQLTDMDEDKLWSGMPVDLIIHRLCEEEEDGLIVYGYEFRPKLEEV